MNTIKSYLLLAMLGLLALTGTAFADSQRISPTRIVVLPFYTETGRDVRDPATVTQQHYRRIQRFINNQLVRHGFDVTNPFAHEWTQAQHDAMAQRSRSDSILAAKDLNRRYSTDVAYLVWLDVKYLPTTPEGLCKVQARIEGEGYDSADRDLGAGIEKTWIVTRSDCDNAVIDAEKELADVVGRTLTAWNDRQPGYGHTRPHAKAHGKMSAGSDGVLERRAEESETLLNVRLDGVTEYEWAEIFGKVINTLPGVVVADSYTTQIVPNNPQASYVVWRVRIKDNSDGFRFQTSTMTTIKRIIDAGGETVIRGVPYRYSPDEVDELKGIRVGSSTSREVGFVIDRELVRDRDFTERHDPYLAPGARRGFE